MDNDQNGINTRELPNYRILYILNSWQRTVVKIEFYSMREERKRKCISLCVCLANKCISQRSTLWLRQK